MSSTFATAGTSRQNNFDFLRFTLAVMVMFSHCFPLTFGNNDREPLFRLTKGSETFGSLAVAGFFVLSGFLIANSWMNSRGLMDFTRRRIARIYPGLIVATLFVTFVVGPFATSGRFAIMSAARSAASAMYHIDEPSLPRLFLTNPIPSAANGSMWTIWYELMCYVTIAALGLLGALRRPRVVLACFLFTLAVFMMADVSSTLPAQPGIHAQLKAFFTGKLAYFRAPYLVMFFLAGACFWAFKERIPKSPRLAMSCFLGLVAAFFLGRFALHAAMPVLGVYLLIWVAFHDGIPLQRFGKNGDFSYGLYLYAWPVTQSLVYLTGGKWPALLLFVAVFFGTLPLAVSSWFLVERPFLRRKKSPGSVPAVHFRTETALAEATYPPAA